MPDPQSRARRLTSALRQNSISSSVFTERTDLIEQEATLQMVLEGGVLRQRHFADGKRHTVAVYYRDDVINLMEYVGLAPVARDSLLALKGTVVGAVPNATVSLLRSEEPGRADGTAYLLGRELSISRERTASLGRRNAVKCMAHFLCETMARCAEPSDGPKRVVCSLYMTQELIATVVGMSTVHVNRMLKSLRAHNLAEIINNELVVHDFVRLAQLAEFDDGYLGPSGGWAQLSSS